MIFSLVKKLNFFHPAIPSLRFFFSWQCRIWIRVKMEKRMTSSPTSAVYGDIVQLCVTPRADGWLEAREAIFVATMAACSIRETRARADDDNKIPDALLKLSGCLKAQPHHSQRDYELLASFPAANGPASYSCTPFHNIPDSFLHSNAEQMTNFSFLSRRSFSTISRWKYWWGFESRFNPWQKIFQQVSLFYTHSQVSRHDKTKIVKVLKRNYCFCFKPPCVPEFELCLVVKWHSTATTDQRLPPSGVTLRTDQVISPVQFVVYVAPANVGPLSHTHRRVEPSIWSPISIPDPNFRGIWSFRFVCDTQTLGL